MRQRADKTTAGRIAAGNALASPAPRFHNHHTGQRYTYHRRTQVHLDLSNLRPRHIGHLATCFKLRFMRFKRGHRGTRLLRLPTY